ncbi:hypothetical protein ALO95_200048 [Pseudomonas syringae pv. antirrhini]|uniref:Uncharacterized protein n=1 Tax=Pseudomonas syringae pv. antirrhini TaxID=251702 RepID=A0A0P9LSH7_9PSED|nr:MULTISPECIES: hypothetical protein [Pseudomonas]KPW47373.1 hypothetical protein ALO88_200003 [Pseudomonas syringae pv. antirrhini]RMP34268.1 hypothetical protein ALQ23_200006 [Pseudomonas syringae pv. antirrhini]RMW26078.1 hypothetical protein ALO95_200048 [Pseudomonas syringae pv. antirrhini]WIN06910.1 hypothetical protein QQF68_25630 [Pseudomonas syringae pv. antirrhini str. 126]
MINLHRLISWLFPDRRPDWEQKREREFIQAANSLKTLRVTPEGGMSIDPEELRDQIVSAREQLKHLVYKPGAPSGQCQAVAAVDVVREADPSADAPVELRDCIEVVAWRRLPSGSAVRYTCLQCLSKGLFAVAATSLFSGASESLPTWVDGNTDRQLANALQDSELRWFTTVGGAMDEWDAAI